MGLPSNEKGVAFKLLGKAGVNIPNLNLPTNHVQIAIKIIKQFKKALDKARDAGSVDI